MPVRRCGCPKCSHHPSLINLKGTEYHSHHEADMLRPLRCFRLFFLFSPRLRYRHGLRRSLSPSPLNPKLYISRCTSNATSFVTLHNNFPPPHSSQHLQYLQLQGCSATTTCTYYMQNPSVTIPSDTRSTTLVRVLSLHPDRLDISIMWGNGTPWNSSRSQLL